MQVRAIVIVLGGFSLSVQRWYRHGILILALPTQLQAFPTCRVGASPWPWLQGLTQD